MKQDLERVKNDVETIQRALGLPPSFRREWIQWMKRDQWFSLWWCLPGVILIAAALLPFDHNKTYLGLVADQWAGILVAGTLLMLAAGHTRQVSGKDGRPEAMVRESQRVAGLTKQGFWFGVALAVQILAYFVWGKQHHLPFNSFWTGLFTLMGSTCLVMALSARAWVLLGYAIPFMLYGLCLPFAGNHAAAKGSMLGLMFIAIAILFSAIQFWEIRKVSAPQAV